MVHTVAFCGLVVAMLAVGVGLAGWGLRAWLIELALMLASVVIIGVGVNGRVWGLLVDERNMMSLSRFQMVAWTVIVLSAYLTAVCGNVARAVWGGYGGEPLAVELPETLWWLMGISTTSLVGAPIIRTAKANLTAPPADAPGAEGLRTLTAERLRKQEATPTNQGAVVLNPTPHEAALADLFRGEEVSNAASTNLAKVQMFYFTLVVLLSYCAALGAMFAQAGGPIQRFPDLSQAMVALLGISHAGYLLQKAAPQTPDPERAPAS